MLRQRLELSRYRKQILMAVATAQARPTAERARTLLATARTANLQTGCRLMAPIDARVRIESDDQGLPTVLVPESSPTVAGLGACRVATLTVTDPDSVWSLRLVGSFRMECPDGSGLRAYRFTILSIRIVGATETTIPVGAFLRAEPDPLRDHAAALLRHLDTDHASELMDYARAQGHDTHVLRPRSVDSHGIEFSLLGLDGVEPIRWDFPGGPVRTIGDAMSSLPVDCSCW